MDIQGHIIDVWIGKTSKEHPILTVYDPEGKYYPLLPLVAERGVRVIDTTRKLIENREAACDCWMNELVQNEDARMLIYRREKLPKNDKERVLDPFIGITQVGARFPIGPNDDYINLCKSFLPGKRGMKTIVTIMASEKHLTIGRQGYGTTIEQIILQTIGQGVQTRTNVLPAIRHPQLYQPRVSGQPQMTKLIFQHTHHGVTRQIPIEMHGDETVFFFEIHN